MPDFPGEGQPADGTSQVSSVVRDRFDALYQMDLKPLRVRAQTTPGLTVFVESDLNRAYVDGNKPLDFAGGNSPTFTAPTTNPRIDLLALDRAAVLSIIQGTPAASPVPPTYPFDKLVVAEIFCRVGMTSIKNLNDGAQGYIYKRRQPFCNLTGAVAVLAKGTMPNLTNTTTETTLISFTVPGGTLGTVNRIQFFLDYFHEGNIGQTLTIRYKYGGTTLESFVHNLDVISAASPDREMIEMGATNSQRWTTGGGTSAIDSTVDQTFAVTGQFSNASAANILTGGPWMALKLA